MAGISDADAEALSDLLVMARNKKAKSSLMSLFRRIADLEKQVAYNKGATDATLEQCAAAVEENQQRMSDYITSNTEIMESKGQRWEGMLKLAYKVAVHPKICELTGLDPPQRQNEAKPKPPVFKPWIPKP